MPDVHPNSADRALQRAIDIWGGPNVLDCLSQEWRRRVRKSDTPPGEIRRVLEELRSEHQATARPDLERVHPSWWVRALQDESSTIRRAVAAYGPEPIRERLRSELGLDGDRLIPTSAPNPDAASCVLALWSEPFVGGPPLREEDPPIAWALVGSARSEVTRLIAIMGLAKLAAIPDEPVPAAATARTLARWRFFRTEWGETEPGLVRLARSDVARTSGREVRNLPRLGLISVGRLLGAIDPTRSRWILQQLPYAVARAIRSDMEPGSAGAPPPLVETWESRTLELSQHQLSAEMVKEGEG